MSAKKILVIDDDTAVRYTLKKILLNAGFEVLEAPKLPRKVLHDFAQCREDIHRPAIVMIEIPLCVGRTRIFDLFLDKFIVFQVYR